MKEVLLLKWIELGLELKGDVEAKEYSEVSLCDIIVKIRMCKGTEILSE